MTLPAEGFADALASTGVEGASWSDRGEATDTSSARRQSGGGPTVSALGNRDITSRGNSRISHSSAFAFQGPQLQEFSFKTSDFC